MRSRPCVHGSTGSLPMRRRARRSCAGRSPARSRASRCALRVVERAAVEQLAAAAELRAEADPAYAPRAARGRGRAPQRLAAARRGARALARGGRHRRCDARAGVAGRASLRDRLRAIVTGRPADDGAAGPRSSIGVEAVVRAAAERAAERTPRAWRERSPARPCSTTAPGLDARLRRSSRPRGRGGARLAGRRPRPRPRGGGLEARDRAARLARRQRGRASP